MNQSKKPRTILRILPQKESKASYGAQRGKQSGFALPIAILIVAILIVAGGAGYYFYLSRDEVLRDKTSQEQKEQVVDETADWETHINEKYGFEIKYPQDWEIVNVDWIAGSEYVRFLSPLINNKYYFVLDFGARNKGDNTQISYQPDEDWELLKSLMRLGDKVKIGNVDVLTTEIVEKGKVHSILYSNRLGAGRIEISGLEIQANSGFIEGPQYLSASDVESIDLKNLPELKLASQILSTFKFIEIEEVKEKAPKIEEVKEEIEKEELEEKKIGAEISCTTNSDCGADACRQERNVCFEVSYVCENGKCSSISKEYTNYSCARYYYGSINFTGGTILEVEYKKVRPEIRVIAEKLADFFGSISIQPTGEKGIILKMKHIDEATHQQVLQRLGEVEEKYFESVRGTIDYSKCMDTCGDDICRLPETKDWCPEDCELSEEEKKEEAKKLINEALLKIEKVKSEEDPQKLQLLISEAINSGKRAVELDPKNPEVLFQMGNIYFEIKEFVSGADVWAEYYYKKALELDPDNPLYQEKLREIQ